MKHKIKIYMAADVLTKNAEDGTNLWGFLYNESIDILSPFGGQGTCGKCCIKVKGLNTSAQGKELELLGKKMTSQDYRLA